MTVSTPRRPGLDLSEIELDALLKRLHLANLRRVYHDAITRAEDEQWSYRDFLALLVAEEVAHRKQTRLQRLTRRARFPYLKTIDDFDFTLQSNLRVALLGSYLSPDFVTEGRSLVFHGQTGRGKTHLAIAIGYRAIQNGFDALFTTAAHLIEDLSNAGRHGRLHDALETYTHPHVLVIDEVGYLTYGPDAANVLYHVVNDRHLRKRPMVFTTNKPLNAWGRVLHDPDLAAAILDRVLERGRWITLDGPSGRTKHLKLETTVPQDAGGARVSGKPVPEFPEPTPHPRALFEARSSRRAELVEAVSETSPCAPHRQMRAERVPENVDAVALRERPRIGGTDRTGGATRCLPSWRREKEGSRRFVKRRRRSTRRRGGEPPRTMTVRERMARMLRTRRGRRIYSRRKAIVEPVIGQIKQARGFRQFLDGNRATADPIWPVLKCRLIVGLEASTEAIIRGNWAERCTDSFEPKKER